MNALCRRSTTDCGVPLIAMTYYNVAFRMGHARFAAALRESGITAAILPDLPLEEVGPWAEAADADRTAQAQSSRVRAAAAFIRGKSDSSSSW